MKKLGSILVTAVAACILSLAVAATPAHALPYTFTFTFTGATMTAVGSITFNGDYLTALANNSAINPGTHNISLINASATPYLSALSILVSGYSGPNAAFVNTTFTLSDFSDIFLYTNDTTLDFTQSLTSQYTSGPQGSGNWFTPGDFGLIGDLRFVASNIYAPTYGFDVFQMLMYNGELANMASFNGPNTVPEPSTFLLLGSGLAGIGFLRRRFRRRA